MDHGSPIAKKKSRKRKVLDDSEGEEENSESLPEKNDLANTSTSSPNSVAATISDADIPCSSTALQQSTDMLSTPPKRLTGMVYIMYIICLLEYLACSEKFLRQQVLKFYHLKAKCYKVL